MADTSALSPEPEDDVAFCRWLVTEGGVAAIPPSLFFSDEGRSHARKLARFAFCKTDPVLAEGARRLEAAKR